jgi:preprotein translocase subunit YajC
MIIKRKILTLGFLVGIMGLLSLTGCALTSEGSGSATGFNWTAVAMVLALIALFYFLIIRPQNNRRKEQQKLLSGLKPGDQVIAAGGIYGEIESLSADSVVIKVESGAKIRVAKQSLMVRRSPNP